MKIIIVFHDTNVKCRWSGYRLAELIFNVIESNTPLSRKKMEKKKRKKDREAETKEKVERESQSSRHI